jgi:Transposase DDE domain
VAVPGALRGLGTLWLDEAAVTGGSAPQRSTPGGQPIYSELAIERVLSLRRVFHLALRQAEAFGGSFLRLLGLDLSGPDPSTLSRRGIGAFVTLGGALGALRHGLSVAPDTTEPPTISEIRRAASPIVPRSICSVHETPASAMNGTVKAAIA